MLLAGADVSVSPHGTVCRLHQTSSCAYRDGMQLTEEDIQEFQLIWLEEFGETISREQARHEILLLMKLYEVIARPLPSKAKTDVYEPNSMNQ